MATIEGLEAQFKGYDQPKKAAPKKPQPKKTNKAVSAKAAPKPKSKNRVKTLVGAEVGDMPMRRKPKPTTD
jgi:hypothetical protein